MAHLDPGNRSRYWCPSGGWLNRILVWLLAAIVSSAANAKEAEALIDDLMFTNFVVQR